MNIQSQWTNFHFSLETSCDFFRYLLCMFAIFQPANRSQTALTHRSVRLMKWRPGRGFRSSFSSAGSHRTSPCFNLGHPPGTPTSLLVGTLPLTDEAAGVNITAGRPLSPPASGSAQTPGNQPGTPGSKPARIILRKKEEAVPRLKGRVEG